MNYLAILAAGIFNMVLGFLWYGPIFGKPWMKYMGITKEQMEKAKSKQGEMMQKYGLMFVATLVLAYFLEWLIVMRNVTSISQGAMVGGMVWLGFVATTQFSGWLFSGKKVGLYLIDTSYFLVSFVVLGAIFAVWR